MGFAQLPPAARDFVFSGRLSYNAAVALGRASDTIIEYTLLKMGASDDEPLEVDKDFDKVYKEHIGLLIAQVCNRKLNSTAATKFISGQVEHMRRMISAMRSRPGEEDTLLELVSSTDQWRAYKTGLSSEYAAALIAVKASSIDSVKGALRLHERLAGDVQEGTALRDELQHRLGRFGVASGRLAVQVTMA